MPSLPHTKTATTNQDLTNVSVRGQAWLDWNANTFPPPTPPTAGERTVCAGSMIGGMFDGTTYVTMGTDIY
jgi:hypothetical protein